jgi:hypothetical protein
MVLSILERLAARRRRPGAHPVWTAVALAAFLMRRYQKRAAKDAVALREVLHPGETLVITHIDRPQG